MAMKMLSNSTIVEEDEDRILESSSFRQNKSKCHRVGRRTALVLVSLFAVHSLALSVYTLVKYKQIMKEEAAKSGFCVLCSELYPVGYVDERVEEIIASLDRHTDDGIQICCARNFNERSKIMRLQLKRRDSLTYPRMFNSTKIDTNDFNFGSISAHKTLGAQVPINGNSKPEFGDEFYMLHLRMDNDVRYEHVSGVDVTSSGLKVKVPGLYFVYKSIFFVPDSGHPCKTFREQTFRSMLLRNSTLRSSRIDVLLRSEHTCCPNCVQHRETAFTGGIFYLDEGDLIEVEISAYGLVYFKPDVTYMGIIIVGGSVPKHT